MQVNESLAKLPPLWLLEAMKKPVDPFSQLGGQLRLMFAQTSQKASIGLQKISAEPLLPRYIVTPSKNMAGEGALGLCLAGVKRPLKKDYLNKFVKKDGFRITQDITLAPQGRTGLCLGMGTALLHAYHYGAEKTPYERTLAGAHALHDGATPCALASQTLYDAIMPRYVDANELNEWRRLVDTPACTPNVPQTRNALLTSLRTYFEVLQKNPNETLRKFVLDDLDSKKCEITPEIYAIVLDLDSLMTAKKENIPLENASEKMHMKIFQTVLNQEGLKIAQEEHCGSGQPEAVQKLRSLLPGAYMLNLPDHTAIFIKLSAHESLLFDPFSGLAAMDTAEKEKASLEAFFRHYFGTGNTDFHLSAIAKK